MEDIFGSDDENSERRSNSISAPVQAKIAHSKFCIPNRVSNVQESSQGIMVRMPNFVKLQSTPFEKSAHPEKLEEEQFAGATAVIRWRNKLDENGEVILDANGKPIKESNARLVKYADGTMALLVGNETFNIGIHPLNHSYAYSHETSTPANNPLDYAGSTPAPFDIPIITTSCLECVHSIDNTMKIEPLSLTSAAHVRTSLEVSNKYKKVTKISTRDFASIEENPELDLKLRIQMEEKEARAERKRKQHESYTNNAYGYNSNNRNIGMNANYLEQDDYDTVNLTSLKNNKYTNKPKEKPRHSLAASILEKKKRKAEEEDEDSEEDSEEEEDPDEMNDFIVKEGDEEEEEEEDWSNKRSTSNTGKKQTEDDDSEEEEEEEDSFGTDDDDEDDDKEEDEEVEEEKEKKSFKDKHSHKHKNKHSSHDKHSSDKHKSKKEKHSHQVSSTTGTATAVENAAVVDGASASAGSGVIDSEPQVKKQKRLLLDDEDD